MNCVDCKCRPATTHWYSGFTKKHTDGRCNPCSFKLSTEGRDAINVFESQNPIIANQCEDCGELHWEENCKECCDHEYDPDEGMMCLNCGGEYPY